MMALHRDYGVINRAGELIRRHRRDLDHELVDRSIDLETIFVDLGHMVGIDIAEQNVMPAAGHMRADGAANGPGTDNHEVHTLLSIPRSPDPRAGYLGTGTTRS